MKIEEKKWKNWLISQLRRASYKWPERTEAKRKARIERGIYRCNICKGKFAAKCVQLDHRKPIVDPSIGFTNWDNYIKRLFVDAKGFQVLCKPCHKKKTDKENSKRVRSK